MPKPPHSRSRRNFLRGSALSAAGLAVAPHLQAAPKTGDADPFVGPTDVPVTLRVNGEVRTATIEARTTLAEVLREDLGLTGTKVVCDRGSCSCCTVYVDGEPVCSCLTLALDAEQHEVTTIEGLAAASGKTAGGTTADGLHPVQAAFVAHDASMCGFCTPGMVMSCAHLLDHNPDPSLDDVKQATSGNLCRCGTYPKVFAATLDAAKTARG